MTDTKKRPARNKFDVKIERQNPIQEGHEYYKASSQSQENVWYDVHIDLVSMTGHCGCKRNDFIPQMQLFDADKQCMHFHCVFLDLVARGLKDTRPSCVVCHRKSLSLIPAADDNGNPLEGGICLKCVDEAADGEKDLRGLAAYQDEVPTPDYFDMESYCVTCDNDVCLCNQRENL